MCASCGGGLHISRHKALLVATPVPLALTAGFLVPGSEDKLLLWILGVALMFLMYFRWAVMPAQATAQVQSAGATPIPRHSAASAWSMPN